MKNPAIDVYKYCPSCASLLESKVIDTRERKYCPKCGFIFWNNAKPTASMIIEKDGKVLMLKRQEEPFKDHWVLPGGYLEYDETPEDGVKREVYEEINLKTKINRVVDVYLIENDPRGNSVDIVYSGSIIEGEPQIKEHAEYMFFSPDSLPDLIGYNHREMIEKWNTHK